jgi:hypothetical protein
MDVVDPDDLPLGLVRVDASGNVVESNTIFREWAESESPLGHPLSDFPRSGRGLSGCGARSSNDGATCSP